MYLHFKDRLYEVVRDCHMDSLEGNHAPPTFWKFWTSVRGLPTRQRKTGGHDLYGCLRLSIRRTTAACCKSFTSSDLEAASCSGLALT